MEEIWKNVPNYDGMYQVSNLGRVKSFKKNKEKILINSKHHSGYLTNKLSKNNVSKSFMTHQLVAICFLNHSQKGMSLVIDHINNDKSNNKVENLQVITQRENSYKNQGKYSSKYKGVSWHKLANKWIAGIYIKGKKYNLGLFINEKEASDAYQLKLKTL